MISEHKSSKYKNLKNNTASQINLQKCLIVLLHLPCSRVVLVGKQECALKTRTCAFSYLRVSSACARYSKRKPFLSISSTFHRYWSRSSNVVIVCCIICIVNVSCFISFGHSRFGLFVS